MASPYSPESFRWFTSDQRSLKELIERFPEDWVRSDVELKSLLTGGGAAAVLQAAKDSKVHLDRIVKSGLNPEVTKHSLPVLVRARMMVLALKNYSLAAQTKTTGRIAFDEDNARLLQALLFEGSGFVRRPVDRAEFARVWPLVTQKSFLMPLVNKKGIYCFYTAELVQALARRIGGRSCVEVGAGDGTLSRFLTNAGCPVRATDNYSWSAFVDYPDDVEKLDAAAALRKYRPAVVLASWPDPENPWEGAVFDCGSVETYIVLGSAAPGVTGNPGVYGAQTGWRREEQPEWGTLIVPEELQGQVLVFERRK